MNDRGVSEAVFVFFRHRNRVIDVACADERQERHHLFDADERMMFVGLAEHHLRTRPERWSRPLVPGSWRLADEVLARRVVLVVADFDDRLAGQFGNLLCVKFNRTGSSHRGHHGVENTFNDEHFLFSDAQQVVVIRPALDDALGSVVEVGRFVDNHRRVARARRQSHVCRCSVRLVRPRGRR